MSAELLPCPFCGGVDAFVERRDYSSAYVQCDSLVGPGCACMARGPLACQDDDGEEIPGEKSAITAWNRRAALAQKEAAAPVDERAVMTAEQMNSLFHTIALKHGIMEMSANGGQCDLLIPLVLAELFYVIEKNCAALAHPVAVDANAKRLQFMSEHGAWIAWTKDCETCRVFIRNEDGDCLPILGWNTPFFYTLTEAIDAAMKGKP